MSTFFKYFIGLISIFQAVALGSCPKNLIGCTCSEKKKTTGEDYLSIKCGNFEITFYNKFLILDCQDKTDLSNFKYNISFITQQYPVESMNFMRCIISDKVQNFNQVIQLFNTQEVPTLGFAENTLMNLTKNVLEPFRNLSFLNFHGKNIIILEPHALSSLQSLEMIYIRDNAYLSLPNRLFTKENMTQNNLIICPNLTSISLINNGIEEIPRDLFAKMINLLILDISSNFLNSLSPVMFRDLVNLQRLILSNNNLNTLSPKLFRKLINLRVLDLSHNKLIFLPQKIFEKLINVQKIMLHNNNIKRLRFMEFKRLPNLQVVDCQYNCLEHKDDSRQIFFTLRQDHQKPCNSPSIQINS